MRSAIVATPVVVNPIVAPPATQPPTVINNVINTQRFACQIESDVNYPGNDILPLTSVQSGVNNAADCCTLCGYLNLNFTFFKFLIIVI